MPIEISRNVVVSSCRERLASDPQYEDWKPLATSTQFTVSLSYSPKCIYMNYAPVRRPKLDPYEQIYGKEMYLSDISDSDGESRLINISKGRKGRHCRCIVFNDIVDEHTYRQVIGFLLQEITKYIQACLAHIRLHTIPYVLFECASDIFVKHVLIQVPYLR